MDDIYVYIVDLPPNVNEMVVPCCDGYTVYIDVKLSFAEKLVAYNHAMEHIRNDDHASCQSVAAIEAASHGHGKELK